jgi:hypothetical protein
MSIGQLITTQVELVHTPAKRSLTVFSPPGICVEPAKYPYLLAGVLASTDASEYLSIYDHPGAWKGLDREAVITMRRSLYRFVTPINAREMYPSDTVHALQTLALSVKPVAIRVEAGDIPPVRIQTQPALLPSSPSVTVKSLELISEPEITKVAERITGKDIPASESICQLLDYDYTLDQVVRLLSVGLLGKLNSRRLVPLRGAYKAAIDAYVSKVLMDIVERSSAGTYAIHTASLYGDTFVVLLEPGDPRVDYLRVEVTNGSQSGGYSLEDPRHPTTDPKTSIYADHARFSAYQYLTTQRDNSHVVVFHHSRGQLNQLLGPWLVRAGVEEALESEPILSDTRGNMSRVLNSILTPELRAVAHESPIPSRLGLDDTSAPVPTPSISA